MDRLTEFDKTRGVYVIKPDVAQGQNIQRLGMLEDRDEAKKAILVGDIMECPVCDREVENHSEYKEFAGKFDFCPNCGQRIKWEV